MTPFSFPAGERAYLAASGLIALVLGGLIIAGLPIVKLVAQQSFDLQQLENEATRAEWLSKLVAEVGAETGASPIEMQDALTDLQAAASGVTDRSGFTIDVMQDSWGDDDEAFAGLTVEGTLKESNLPDLVRALDAAAPEILVLALSVEPIISRYRAGEEGHLLVQMRLTSENMIRASG